MSNIKICVGCHKEDKKENMIGNNIWGEHYDKQQHEKHMDYYCKECWRIIEEKEREHGLRV